jgi:DNA ligase D-like protein (predicted 3'-phosphoesterase)
VTTAKNKLAAYKSRRDFRKSPEPRGKRNSSWKKDRNPIFVVQKHAASHLHYDFRLEIGGVLKSWAVPKGPSSDPKAKRLAVETEDHPLNYADFEGVIPEGEYGGGTVIVWDAGPYRNIKTTAGQATMSMEKAYRQGHIEVWLEGKKIRGGFALIRAKIGDGKKNWLLIKMKGEGANARGNPTATKPKSVLSGRTIAQVERDERGRD